MATDPTGGSKTVRNPLRCLSLFSGIGGLDLGLEAAGIEPVGFVERDDLCRDVLARHWPDVPVHDDVLTTVEWWESEERPSVDVVCGGPPCQPFSSAGRRRGVSDERWLWPAMAAVIRAVRPRYVLMENVAALVRDAVAFGWVLGDLADLRFDAEWCVIPACAVGAPHMRKRLLLVAYPHVQHGSARLGLRRPRQGPVQPEDHRPGTWAHPIDGLMEAANRRDRVANGTAVRLVAAGGNAVVPAVGELAGRMIVNHAAESALSAVV